MVFYKIFIKFILVALIFEELMNPRSFKMSNAHILKRKNEFMSNLLFGLSEAIIIYCP